MVVIIENYPYPYFKITPRSYDFSDDDSSFVQFTMHSASTHMKIWKSRDAAILDQIEVPITGPPVQAGRPPVTYDTFHPSIYHMLSTLRLDSSNRDWLVSEIISDAGEVINAVDCKVSRVWIVSVEIHIVSEFIVLEDGEEMFIDEDGMVPAATSSIASLQQFVYNNKNNDFGEGCSESCAICCAICLEDFLIGSQVTCMPCFHVFHDNCIKKWLTKSHYCPTCRFKMPT